MNGKTQLFVHAPPLSPHISQFGKPCTKPFHDFGCISIHRAALYLVTPAHLWSVWIGCDTDAGGAVLRPSPWQPLEELFRNKRHDGRQEAESHLQTGVESLSADVCLFLPFWICPAQHWLHTFLYEQKKKRKKHIKDKLFNKTLMLI